MRAMETAGRAVVFSGTTVAIGLLAMIVLPLPFLRSIGYAGMLIPLISVIVAVTLLPIVLAKVGDRLDWPHVRSDDKASRSWTSWARFVVRRRWIAAAVAAVVLAALVVSADRPRSPEPPNVDTLAKQGDAHAGLVALERSGIGAGALQPIEVLSPASANPATRRGGAARRAGRARRGRADRAAVAPRAASRSSTRSRSPTARRRPDATRSRTSAPRPTRRAPASASAGSAPRTRTSSRRSTGASRR